MNIVAWVLVVTLIGLTVILVLTGVFSGLLRWEKAMVHAQRIPPPWVGPVPADVGGRGRPLGRETHAGREEG